MEREKDDGINSQYSSRSKASRESRIECPVRGIAVDRGGGLSTELKRGFQSDRHEGAPNIR